MTTGRRTFSSTSLLVAFLRRVIGEDESLEECQKTTGIHRNLLHDYEHDRHAPGDRNLSRLLQGYGISPALKDRLLALMSELAALLADPQPSSERSSGIESLLKRPFPVSLAPPPAPDTGDQLARLFAFGHSDRLVLVRVSLEFRSFSLAVRLCDESRAAAARSAGDALELAELALAVSDLIDDLPLRGYAWGHLGNAHRVAGNLDRADRDFARARDLWGAGPDNAGPLDPGRLLSFEASLRRAQRQFPASLALLARAEPLSRDPAHVVMKQATVLEQMGDYDGSLRALARADALLPSLPTREPRDQFLLLINRGVSLCHLGRHEAAQPLADEAVSLAARLRNPLDFLRAVWLSGRVAAGLSQILLAEDLFRTVRQEFEREKLGYDFALVSLELAAVLLRTGNSAETLGIAADLVGRFDELKIHREARLALELFYDAVHCQAASADLAQKVVAYLYRAQHDDQLRFT